MDNERAAVNGINTRLRQPHLFILTVQEQNRQITQHPAQ